MLLQLTVSILKCLLFDMLYDMLGSVVSFADECLDGLHLTFWRLFGLLVFIGLNAVVDVNESIRLSGYVRGS